MHDEKEYMMTQRSALEIVLAYQEAWTHQDFATAASYLASEVVFDSQAQYVTGVQAFMDALTPFASRIVPGWQQIAAFDNDREALLMYTVTTTGGAVVRAADYFMMHDGKIQLDKLVFATEVADRAR
jgi:SnoaL-like domain